MRRVDVARKQHKQGTAHNEADHNLKIDFLLRGEAEVLLLGDFGVVVNEADNRKSRQGEERDQNEGIREISPEQRRNCRGQHDEHATHRRRSRFFLMGLGTFFADILANLKLAQLANQPRTKDQRQEHRGQAGVNRAHRDVAKNVERAEVAPQNFDEEVVKHPSA